MKKLNSFINPVSTGVCSFRPKSDFLSIAGALVLCTLIAQAGRAAEVKEDPIVKAMDRSGLMLELRFDGNLADNSGANRTANGTVEFVAGRQGTRAALFNGSNWVNTGFLQKELGAEFTVECWVNPAKQKSKHADIFGNHVSGGQGFMLYGEAARSAGYKNDFYAAYDAGTGRWVRTEAVALTPGRWEHVALVKTRADLRFYLNGVLASVQPDPAPVRPSSLPVHVGLGHDAKGNGFYGLVSDFRIWNRALASFEHAGIAPADGRDILAQRLEATPRPAAGALVQSWTLSTDDTRLTFGVTAAGEPVISELSCPAARHNWIGTPVAFGLLSEIDIAGRRQELQWRFVDAAVDDSDGRHLTLRFACTNPALEAVSEWRAYPGPGPVHHSMLIRNLSGKPISVRGQPIFDLDLTGASTLWSFHTDGVTPDAVGVYQHPLAADPAGQRYTVLTDPTGEFIPYVVLDADARHGVYMGLEWSFCRIDAVLLAGGASRTLRLRGGVADRRIKITPGDAFEVPPGFIGAYQGDLDDAGNRLRRWLFTHCVPAILREDPGYPKVQWNACRATGKTPHRPGSWDPVEAKYYPLIDDIAPLGFEEVMIDIGWWQGDWRQDAEPDFDKDDWPSGMRKAAEYAHGKGMRFGLYWTDRLNMADPKQRGQRAARIRRLFEEYRADLWRSDSIHGRVISFSHASVRGFYEMVDALAREVPGFQWENCQCGGQIKDYGAMRRSVKIFNSDTYSALDNRKAFYDSSFAFHPTQIMGHLGRIRSRGVVALRFAFRSMSMGAPEWFIDAPNGGNGAAPWTQEEKDAVKACVATYKERLRPLIRAADLYHIFPRPDGRNWDGIEYYDPAAAKGVVYLFKPAATADTQVVRLKGLDARATYRLSSADGTTLPAVKTGAELMTGGLPVTLPAGEVSELVFFEPHLPARREKMGVP